ncbi:MAG TPA: TOBE domain-containing protein, partial [Nitrospinota bacterium]|nr:TOBE domain-containing protein [Nitrospinota bacterium]
MTLADRIVVMRDGHINQVGTPLEIYHDPVNLFVADFFGSPPMNLLEGEIHRENGTASFRAGEFIVRLTGPVPEVEGAVTLGIRPEHMAIGDAGSAGEEDFSAKVVLVEPLGKDILLYLDYGSEKNLIAVVEGHRDFQTDTAVSVHLQTDRLYYFGADERRLRPADAARTTS